MTLLLLALPVWADAQPLGWAAGLDRLEVVDLPTGALRAAYDAPTGVRFAPGALTPDGRYYLLPTTRGVVRFRTDTRALDGPIGPATGFRQLAMSPTGRLVYGSGPDGHAVFDWESGDSISSECCAVHAVHFTPDGRLRLELRSVIFGEYVLTAFATATGAVAWHTTIDAHWVDIAVQDAWVALSTDYSDSRSVVVLSAHDGSRRAWFAGMSPNDHGMTWQGGGLLISDARDFPRRITLESIDATLQRRGIAVRLPVHSGTALAGPVAITGRGGDVVWLYHDAPTGTEFTTYEVIDPATRLTRFSGRFGMSVAGVTVEDPDRCALLAPAEVTAPVEGGVASIPVTPSGSCDSWSVHHDPRVLNPGPHAGPATVLVQTWPNPEGTPRTISVVLGVTSVRVTQPAGVPAPPRLDVSAAGRRITLAWTPAVGAGITSFVVRGAIAGHPIVDVIALPGDVRSWTSPPLSAGAYEVALVATNGAGRSAMSNPQRVSIGEPSAPHPPTGLTATVVDDRVALAWTPAPDGPAPSGFAIEAAVPGGAFFHVSRTDLPRFVATRVPAGTWAVRVRALTAGGLSGPSDILHVTTAPCSAPPGAPQSLWAVWTPPSVSLTWSPPSSGAAEQYEIEIGTTSGAADLGRLVVPGTRLAHTEGVSMATAFVRLRAYNACGESAPSSEVLIVVR